MHFTISKPNQPVPSTLYRLFAENGDLLYVGVGGNPGRRFEQYRRVKPWWDEVHTSTLDHYPTRESALEAERVAVIEEHPRYNIIHNDRRLPEATEAEFTFLCAGCGSPVEDDSGHLGVDRRAAYAQGQWEEASRAGSIKSPIVSRARWEAWHTTCRIELEEFGADGVGGEGEGWRYEIWINNVRTPSLVLARTAHLMGKRWIGDTDWQDIIGRLAVGAPPTRLRAVG